MTFMLLRFFEILSFKIAKETRPRDLEEFFSSVGHVRDVRIITDSKTRRSKGICYVEFWEIESVNLVSNHLVFKIHLLQLKLKTLFNMSSGSRTQWAEVVGSAFSDPANFS